jgi:hypothetical protein
MITPPYWPHRDEARLCDPTDVKILWLQRKKHQCDLWSLPLLPITCTLTQFLHLGILLDSLMFKFVKIK